MVFYTVVVDTPYVLISRHHLFLEKFCWKLTFVGIVATDARDKKVLRMGVLLRHTVIHVSFTLCRPSAVDPVLLMSLLHVYRIVELFEVHCSYFSSWHMYYSSIAALCTGRIGWISDFGSSPTVGGQNQCGGQTGLASQ